ncbi:MAG TPA: hypothetical protein VH678_28920 [Xanthobacteraceae bacterium]|jgi:hypothetical protein
MRGASLGPVLLVAAFVLGACSSSDSTQKLSNYQEMATPVTLTPKQLASVRAGIAKGFADRDLHAVNLGRTVAGRTSTSVVVCGYINGKNAAGEAVGDTPFHGLFMGLDNASGFVITQLGGTESDNAATFEDCRRSGLDISHG